MVQTTEFVPADTGSWPVPDGVKKLRLVVEAQDGRSASSSSQTGYGQHDNTTGVAGDGGLATGYLTDQYLSYAGGDNLYIRPGTGPSGGAGGSAYEDRYNSDAADAQADADGGDGGNASAVYLNGDGSTTVLIVGGGAGGSAAAGAFEGDPDSADDPVLEVGAAGDGGLTSATDGSDVVVFDTTYTGGGGGDGGQSDGSGDAGASNSSISAVGDTEYVGAAAAGGGGGGASNDGGETGQVGFEGADNAKAAGSGGGQGAVGIASNVSGTLGGSNHADGRVAIQWTQRVQSPTISIPNLTYHPGYLDLTWPDVGEAGYRVYRATSSGAATPADYTEIADVGSDTSYRDGDVAEETTYYYRILSEPSNSNLDESIGAEVSATTKQNLGSIGRSTNGVIETTGAGNILTK